MEEQTQNQRLGDRLEEMDRQVLAWAKLTRSHLVGQLLSLGLHEKVALAKTVQRIRIRKTRKGDAFIEKEDFLATSVRHRLRKKQGELEAVGFSFARHGIFLEHGVGRGRPVRSAKAEGLKKPWLGVVLPHSIEELANILEENYADLAAEELRILIPGIVDTTVKVG